MKLIQPTKGFTLIELLIVIAVLGILAVGVLVAINVTGNLDKANLAKAKTFAASVENDLSIAQVGKWSFEGNPNDTSGYGNDGTLAGNAFTETEVNCGLGLRQCLKLDGTGDYVDVGNNAILRPSGSVTISAWVHHTPVAGTPTVFFNCPDGVLLSVLNSTTGNIAFNVGSSLSNAVRSGTSHDGKWHHVTGVYNQSAPKFQIFLDGKLKEEKTPTGSLAYSCSTNARIGAGPVLDAWYGMIDEVVLYKEALTAYQIQQLYAQGWLRHQLARH